MLPEDMTPKNKIYQGKTNYFSFLAASWLSFLFTLVHYFATKESQTK